ncbi:acyl-CoA dehydrogenase family protein [Streptomyces sp. NPDC047928]|uniref:acyl-CoA dehydrogenase family protein n=1 Tax=unclassified Streptomyces TaxID=2593676 RepID=UPI0037150A45
MAADHTRRTGPGGTAGFLSELHQGRLRWDLVYPFPEQSEADRKHGDAVVADAADFLREHLDPLTVDREGRLPDGFHERCAERGWFRLQDPQADGGHGLSAYNAFRLIQAVASWSTAAATSMALHLGLGAGAYLPALPDGELKDELTALLAEGLITGDADTEPTGALNRTRKTVAVPADDGSGWFISGRKIFIGNGPVAGLLRVSATVEEPDGDRIRLFFVDTRDPGFSVVSRHEYLGLKGMPNAALAFDRVFVPHSRTFPVEESAGGGEWRLQPVLHRISVRGRMYPVSAPALATGRLCLHWIREFVRRRTVAGLPLGEYEEIQRLIATSLAEVFAMESVTDWCLLAQETRPGLDVDPEETAAKNINSLTSWRIVDRTLSLLGGEGYETAASKARRGAQPLPVERAFRDARALRVMGGVDFMVDHWTARRILAAHYENPGTDRAADPHRVLDTDPEPGGDERPAQSPDTGDVLPLSPANRRHRQRITEETAAFARVCRRLTREHPDPEELYARERTLILLSRISAELFTMALVLARAAHLDGGGTGAAQQLAETYCADALHRVADARRQLDATAGSTPAHPYREASARWLHGGDLDFLLRDTVIDGPATATR